MTVSAAEVPGRAANRRIPELESIRGVAALLVVLFHIPHWNHALYDVGLIRNSYLMVELFFVLSGFVIYSAYSTRIVSLGGLFEFQFLRFGRLYPVHLLFLLFYLGIEIGKYLLGARVHLRESAFSRNSIGAFIEHLFLVQAVGPTGNASTFNVPAWSISVEFYTYFLFGLIVLYANSEKLRLLGLAAICSLALLIGKGLPEYRDLLRCLAGFSIGCLTAALVERKTLAMKPALLLAAIAALVAFLQIKQNAASEPAIYLLTSVLTLTIVYSRDGVVKGILRTRWLTRLGVLSYSVYMSHGAIIWFFGFLLTKVLKFPAVFYDGQFAPQLSLPATMFAYAAIVGSVLVVSHFVYERIEKPPREKSRRMRFGKELVAS